MEVLLAAETFRDDHPAVTDAGVVQRPGPAVPFQPTPEEIRALCLDIQAGWSPNERRRRARGSSEADERDAIPMTVPTGRDCSGF